MARTAVPMSFGSRTRSVLGGSVLGGDDLGGAGVRRSRPCWGATRQYLDVQSELLPVLGCAIGALAISLSLLFSWSGNQLKVKYKCKIFYRVLGHDLQSTKIIFHLTEFSETTQTRPVV